MNYLAHLVLADGDEGLRTGAFLGDYVKGREALESLPSSWASGVILHRRIDAWSDQHPDLRAFLSRLQPPWRRYGGVITDVLFDCMLSRHWDRFGPVPLADFARATDTLLAEHQSSLPPRLLRFAAWARHKNLWQRYQDRDLLRQIFAGLAARHKRKSPLAGGLELLDRYDPQIEQVFLALFPDLKARVAAWRCHSSMSSM